MTKTKAVIGSYVGVIVFAIPVFLGAWKFAYPQGLLYLGLALLGTTLNHLLVPKESDITVDRASQFKEGAGWDKKLLAAQALVSIIMFGVAGFDSGRFRWSGPVPLWIPIMGVILMLTGQLLFALAKRENAYFSSTVRIQHERGHRVCDTGLYGFVRHPGYLGLLISLIAFPLTMESYWAFLPAAAGVLLLVTRTLFEDRFLAEKLSGYSEYAIRTKWRLMPGLF